MMQKNMKLKKTRKIHNYVCRLGRKEGGEGGGWLSEGTPDASTILSGPLSSVGNPFPPPPLSRNSPPNRQLKPLIIEMHHMDTPGGDVPATSPSTGQVFHPTTLIIPAP